MVSIVSIQQQNTCIQYIGGSEKLHFIYITHALLRQKLQKFRFYGQTNSIINVIIISTFAGHYVALISVNSLFCEHIFCIFLIFPQLPVCYRYYYWRISCWQPCMFLMSFTSRRFTPSRAFLSVKPNMLQHLLRSEQLEKSLVHPLSPW